MNNSEGEMVEAGSQAGEESATPGRTPKARLVQFAVERTCDKQNIATNFREKVLAHPEKFPFPVWVDWPAVGPDPGCGGAWYRVTADSVQESGALFGEKWTPRTRRVCEHMGRIIE